MKLVVAKLLVREGLACFDAGVGGKDHLSSAQMESNEKLEQSCMGRPHAGDKSLVHMCVHFTCTYCYDVCVCVCGFTCAGMYLCV